MTQRATLCLASTHAAQTTKEAVDLMFSAGGSASPYKTSDLERRVRDIYAACQHITLVILSLPRLPAARRGDSYGAGLGM